MKEAGFTEEEIAKWETSASATSTKKQSGIFGEDDRERDEGDLSNVKWKKQGEEREWDVGKEKLGVVHVDTDKPSAEDKQSKSTRLEREREKRKAKAKASKGDEAWSRPQNGLLKQFKSALR